MNDFAGAALDKDASHAEGALAVSEHGLIGRQQGCFIKRRNRTIIVFHSIAPSLNHIQQGAPLDEHAVSTKLFHIQIKIHHKSPLTFYRVIHNPLAVNMTLASLYNQIGVKARFP
ncbi:hypothetical protein [Sinorhizobium prairiense]|uniref:hypothetical protein n=1 Tax=unclassified Sinorhizobium TaxID=2613772 RepID=UPI0023D8885F|nr:MULTISPECIES: hypothetical protein [unclassified Sinorhizobium]WEJ10696.1 hypothetical protein N0Q90_05875 [Sinorhizobium sp. M103]WEJ14726.1 hypothetical protein N0Q91_14445 [Sinorhizobium sp. K101]WEJ37671.1 hypothetical protein N0R80_05850 [Sinorhizobium sp. C101]